MAFMALMAGPVGQILRPSILSKWHVIRKH